MAIDLNKITLEKSGDSHKIDLRKNDSNSQNEITINLNWTQKKKGFWASLTSSPIDLDLGCFYEFRDGTKNVIDGLQFAHGQGGPRNRVTRQGCYTEKPWIWHSGDDRSGGGEGENMFINPIGISTLKRVIVYCFIYEGLAKWSESNAVVTIKIPGNPDVVVEMGQQNNLNKFCAIVELLFDENSSITVKKLVSFHPDHGTCDLYYNWGMNWRSGSK